MGLSHGRFGLPSVWRRISAVYRLTDRTDVGVSYQFTKQESDLPRQLTNRTRISLRLGYRF